MPHFSFPGSAWERLTWRLRLHYGPECQIVTGQSPEDIGSQASPHRRAKVPPYLRTADSPSPYPLPRGERDLESPSLDGRGKGEGDNLLKSHEQQHKVSAYEAEPGNQENF